MSTSLSRPQSIQPSFSGSQIRVWRMRRRRRRRKKEAAVESPLLLFARVALAVSCGEPSLVPLRAWHITYFFNFSASRWCSPFSLSFSFLVKLILLAFLVLSIRVFLMKKWRLSIRFYGCYCRVCAGFYVSLMILDFDVFRMFISSHMFCILVL